MRVVISDDSVVDSYGERVLVSGIKLDRYLKNPVLLWQHNNWRMPVGSLKDLKVEGSKLTAEPIFHELDDESKYVKQCYDKGVLKGFSIGFLKKKTSSNPADMLLGQVLPTITECELFEVSCVVLPSNPNAIVEKSVGFAGYQVPVLNSNNFQTNIAMLDMIKRTLGLPDVASEQEVQERIRTVVAQAKEREVLEKKLSDLQDKIREEQCMSLIEKAVNACKITKGEQAHYLKLARLDYDAVKSLLDSKPGYESISGQLDAQRKSVGKSIEQKVAERNDWTFSDWQKKDSAGLSQLKTALPDVYSELLQTLKGA